MEDLWNRLRRVSMKGVPKIYDGMTEAGKEIRLPVAGTAPCLAAQATVWGAA
jgi:hypothetical protein